MRFYSLRVQKVIPLTAGSVRLDLSIPEELKSIFRWKAGQFIRFQFEINGEIFEREYSICTAPYEGYLSFAVKKAKNAFVSEFVQNHVKEGDLVSISAPMGTFGIPSRPNEKRTLAAFASGSGIAPIVSIIKDTLYHEPNVQFYLFYGNTNENEAIFKDELTELQKQNPANFFPYFFYTRQEMQDKFFEGKLDAHKIKLIINQIMDWDELDEALICGPKDMIVTLANAIYEQGIPKKNIHYELYEPVEKVFFDDKVKRSTVKEVKVTYTFRKNTKTMNWINNGSSLLTALLDSGVEAPYSCKGGVCGACICAKTEGEVYLDENLVLTENDLNKGKILTCMAHPKTKTLTINLDEA